MDTYDALPEQIKGQISRDEYMWLSNGEKQTLIEDMTTPDDDEPAP